MAANLKKLEFNSTSDTQRLRPSPPWYAKTISTFAFAIIYIPLLLLVIYSFIRKDLDGNFSLTLDWYVKAFEDSNLQAAVGRSLWIGLWSTLVTTVLGTAAALALHRYEFPGKKILDALSLIPLVMPEIVMGLSFLIWFVILRISLGVFSMILAHITFTISYVIITVRTRLHDFDESLEEAARDLGATPWQTFWKVTFPLIFPGVLSGALMAFTLSFDDFLVSFFTSGVGSDTLPIKLYSMIKFGMSPAIHALSTVILGVTLLLVLLMMRPGFSSKKP